MVAGQIFLHAKERQVDRGGGTAAAPTALRRAHVAHARVGSHAGVRDGQIMNAFATAGISRRKTLPRVDNGGLSRECRWVARVGDEAQMIHTEFRQFNVLFPVEILSGALAHLGRPRFVATAVDVAGCHQLAVTGLAEPTIMENRIAPYSQILLVEEQLGCYSRSTSGAADVGFFWWWGGVGRKTAERSGVIF